VGRETGEAVGHASVFLVPDDRGLTRHAILPAIGGRAVNLLGRIELPHPCTYAADFGRLLAELGTREEALGEVWFAPSNGPVTRAEFVDLLEAELGRSIRKGVAKIKAGLEQLKDFSQELPRLP